MRLAFAPTHRLMPFLALLALLPACRAVPPADTPDAAAALLKQLQTEIGQAQCTEDAQCRTVPVGAKACGGPASHLAWSIRQGRPERITALAAQQRDAAQKRLTSNGMVSDCRVVNDPGARCEKPEATTAGPGALAGRCVLRTEVTGGARVF